MTSKRVLMVEGPDDEHVVKHICGQHQLGNIDEIKPYDGKQTLLDAIPVRLKGSDILALGILLDADTDLMATWQGILDRLRSAGYKTVPDKPIPEGTVINAPLESLLPKIGVWLMPDNQMSGILENFLHFLIPVDEENTALRKYAENAIQNIPGNRRFTDLKRPKALIHTWLAWQEEPGKPLGIAVKARYLDSQLPVGQQFANWLRRTFFT
jgi:hypothetical protein